MISWFGIASFIILAFAVITLWQHRKLEKKRVLVDKTLWLLENLDKKDDEWDALADEYNNYVDDYNTYISDYPGKFIALLVGLAAEEKIVKEQQGA